MAESKLTYAELIDLLKQVAEHGDEIRHDLCEEGKELLDEIKQKLGLSHNLDEDYQLVLVFKEGCEFKTHPDNIKQDDWEVKIKCNGKEYKQGTDFEIDSWENY